MLPRLTLGCFFLAIALVGLIESSSAQAGKKGDYKSAKEAYEVGLTFLNQKNLAKGQQALEAALTLSPDEKLKGNIYRAILIPYDKDKDYTKFLGAIEYVIANPRTPAEKSLNRTDVLGFLQERKKEKEAAERYEAKLQKEPKDTTSLYILSAIYSNLLRDAKRAAELTEQLVKLTKDAGGPVDARLTTQLAQDYVKSGKLKEGAELFEKAAEADAKNKGQHLKDAASAWLKADEKEKAKGAAKAASSAGFDEKKPKLNQYYFHRGVADVLLETGEYKLSIQHFEKAIDLTTNATNKKACQKKLDEAKAKLSKS